MRNFNQKPEVPSAVMCIQSQEEFIQVPHTLAEVHSHSQKSHRNLLQFFENACEWTVGTDIEREIENNQI